MVLLQFNFELNATNIDLGHKNAFQKLAKYFKESYDIEIDVSGSDTTRLCFFSYDPDIVIKENIASFEISESDLPVVTGTENQEKVNIEKFLFQVVGMHSIILKTGTSQMIDIQ